MIAEFYVVEEYVIEIPTAIVVGVAVVVALAVCGFVFWLIRRSR